MKHIVLALILVLVVQLGQSQSGKTENYTIQLSHPSEQAMLEIDVHDGTVTVEGYNGKEVKIAMTVHEDKKSDQWPSSSAADGAKKGLKRIAKTAADVDIEEYNNKVEIDAGPNTRVDFVIQVPVNCNLEIGTHHNGDVVIKNVSGEIEVDMHHGGLKAEGVSGSIVANSHHGDMHVGFKSVDSSKPMAFSTYQGDVDITFPSNANFNAKVKSTKGDVYTDFDFDLTSEPAKKNVDSNGRQEIKLGGWMHGAVGSGGQEYSFQTYNGDIILRKS